MLLCCCTLALAGCGPPDGGDAGGAAKSAAARSSDDTASVRAAAPTWNEGANARYAGPMGEAVTLVDGTWEGAPFVEGGASTPRAVLAPDFLLRGDLDGDGREESVVLVWTSMGGSGTFGRLSVLERGADGAVSERASAPLGDRVQVRGAEIVEARVVLGVVQPGPKDPRCCPGQKMRRTFALEGNTMKETSSEDRGRLSPADLDGEWVLRELGRGGEVPDEVEISARFENGQIAGKAACNRYTGKVEGGDVPGDLSLAGPLAVSRMMCPPELMEWERRYLQALEGTQKFSFTAGRLVLTGRDDQAVMGLVFAPAFPSGD